MRLCEELETGEEVEVDMEADVLTVLASGKRYPLKPIGDVRTPCSTPWPHPPLVVVKAASLHVLLGGRQGRCG